jgi:hypothetical protein
LKNGKTAGETVGRNAAIMEMAAMAGFWKLYI